MCLCTADFVDALCNKMLDMGKEICALTWCSYVARTSVGWLEQDAVGDRVTVRFADGRAVRVALPFTPIRPLPGLALEALKEALDPPVWHALFCRFITCPGKPSQSCCGKI